MNYTSFTIIASSLVIAALCLLPVPFANAQTGQYFGGQRTSILTCTCSGNQLVYIQDYASNGVKALIYQPGSRLFSNNNVFGTYLLGSYSSGGECKMIAYPECYTVNSDGQFSSSPGVGTS